MSENKYRVRVPIPGSKVPRSVIVYGDYDEAEKKRIELLCDVVVKGKTSTSNMTVGDLCDKWLKQLVVEKTTYQGYIGKIDCHIKPIFGETVARKLTSEDLQQQYATWEKSGNKRFKGNGLSKTTVHALHVIIHEVLEYGVHIAKVIDHNVAKDVNAPSPNKRRVNRSVTYNKSEASKLLASAHKRKSSLYVPIILALFCGLRRGEVFGLPWKHVDFERKQLYVGQVAVQLKGVEPEIKSKPKTEASEDWVPMDSWVCDVLRKHKAAQNEIALSKGKDWRRDLDLVCADDENDGNIVKINNMYTKYKWVVKAAGIKYIGFHDLRHSCATIMKENGADIHTIKSILRHESIATTSDIYVDETPESDRKAVEELSAGVRKPA